MTSPALHWSFLDTGERAGAWNMAFDEQLAAAVRRGESGPLLRLFRWRPRAVSLGLHQDEDELDAAGCAAEGVDIVRRPTGGRAILHHEELTYSVVMPARGGIMEVYDRIARALVRGLQMFGAPVEIARVPSGGPGAAGSPSSIPCFSSTAKYEIAWRGRKLVGSAQRQYREEGVVLQHGSILAGPGHRRLVRYLRLNGEMRDRLTAELERKTVDLREITGRDPDLQELSACVRRGFEEEWHITLNDIATAEGRDAAHAPFQTTSR